MVQSLSPDISPRTESGLAAGRGVTSWVDRLRRLVLPDQAERIPSNRPSKSSGSRPKTATRSTAMTRVATLVPRLLFGICAVLLALAVGLFAFRALYGDRIYPAVVVGDVEVGGLSQSEARAKLSDRASTLEQTGITLSYGGQTWTPTLAELGGDIKIEEALSEAHTFGRNGDAIDRLNFTSEILKNDQTIPLRSTLDTATLNAWFDSVDQDMNNFAVDATLTLTGTEITVTPDSTGTIVDREAATTLILQSLKDLQPYSGELPTKNDNPKVVVADLEPYRAQLANTLSKNIRVDFEDSSWRIEPETIGQYLVVTQTYVDNKVKIDIEVNQDALAKYLRDTFSADINRAPVNATVGWKAGTGLIATSASSEGMTMKPGEFASLVSQSFLDDHNRVDIPVIVTKPKIDQDNLGTLKIDGIIGRGDSNYEGSTDSRATNVGVGVSLLNGTLIGPGDLFSFNAAIGEITADKGYVESAVVVAEQVGRDIGGGICQVSTTMFRAALMSGMTIGQWNPHTYRIQSYERDGWQAGFDASILQTEGQKPSQWGDLTFTNNTDGYILIQSWTNYPHVIIEVFGHQDGRTVSFTDEYVSNPIPAPDTADERIDYDMPAGTWDVQQYALDGLQAGFLYTVTDTSEEVITTRYFETYFKERGITYKVSPDMVGQSPGG